jgi:protein-S-isoprenylcysteine O-methyltransferase Ste14
MDQENKPENQAKGTSSIPPSVRGAVRFLALMVLMLAALFLSAGTFRWLEAWILLGMAMLNMVILAALLSAELRIERNSDHDDTKQWDRWLAPLVVVVFPLLVYLVAGLDHRYGWSPESSTWVKALGGLGVLSGYILSDWAMLSNPFFSANVRIQAERGHKVIEQGPYRWMRHPGYAGGLLAVLGIPFLLGSFWAFVPAGLWMGSYLLRTAMEDETLKQELNGYVDYTRQVRHRIFPGLW